MGNALTFIIIFKFFLAIRRKGRFMIEEMLRKAVRGKNLVEFDYEVALHLLLRFSVLRQ